MSSRKVAFFWLSSGTSMRITMIGSGYVGLVSGACFHHGFERMTTPVLVDLRNVYSPEEADRHGFAYTWIGRG